MRAHVITVSENEHLLLLLVHHSAADGWSMGLLVRELSEIYGSLVRANRAAALPTVAVQHRAFAKWQRATLAGSWLSNELAWWRNELAGAPRSFELPTDRPRTAGLTFEGSRRSVVLPLALLQQLRKIASAQGTTLYSVLLGAYATLLHRYSGQTEVVVGTVVANRSRADLENTVGLFANTIPLRISFADKPSFNTVVQRVHEVFLRVSEHTDIPFEQLALELHDGARTSDPLVQVMFLLQNNQDASLTFGDVAIERVDIGAAGAKVELTLSMTEQSDGLRAALQFRRSLFDEGTIDRMLSHLGILLQSACDAPDASMATAQLLPAAEHDVLTALNDTEQPFPQVPLHAIVRDIAKQFASSPAVVADDAMLSYAALYDRSTIIKNALVSLGVEPGARVAFCMNRHRDLVPTMLAVLRCGAAYVPLDPAYPAERIAHVLSDAQASVVVVDDSAPVRDAAGAHVLRLGALPVAAAEFDVPDADVDPESLAYILYTSGSTGKPKGVMIPHRGLVNFLVSMQERPGLDRA